MRRWRRWIAAVAVLALLSAIGWYFFGPQPEAPYVPEKPAPTAEERAAKADAAKQLEQAVAAAFPRGTLLAADGKSARSFDEHRLIEAPFGPVLVSRGRTIDAGHAESGAIAVHYLAPAEGGFRLVRAFPEAVLAGSFGELSEWAVSDRFSDLPVIYAEGGMTAQGYSCSYTVLTELTPRGPIALASVQTGYDDNGAKEQGAQTYEGKIGEIAKGKGFAVAFTGTRSFVERYTRAGDRFVLEGGNSQVPTC